MELFSPATRHWFRQHFDGATEAQTAGWPVIAAGDHVLITAPTGSGKTLAAFLWSIDRLMRVPAASESAASGTRVLYISPLKALVYDIERNLRAPLAGIARSAALLGEPCAPPRVAIRTGDTSARERQQQLKAPAEILVTTPESLYLLLGSRAAENLRRVDTVIVDEVHALAATKRGAHLALSLERLALLCEQDPQRIGLSATVKPLAEAACWLGGDRPVRVVDAAAPPRLDLRVTVPVADMERPPSTPDPDPNHGGGPILGELYAREVARPPAEKGMWSAIYPALLDEILGHRSTIVFVNSRGLCERLCRRLNEVAAGEDELDAIGPGLGLDSGATPADTAIGDDAPVELVRAHHGSVSHERRAEIEDGLKRGTLRAIVATSSLEMGIDMGGVDQVLLVESPGSVARGLQRVGRAGHGVGEVSSGRIFPKFRGDLLECAVIAARMLEGELEPFRMPRNALDVLAQQIAAHCVGADRSVDDIRQLVNRAGPYRELGRGTLEAVLDMLSGRFPSSDFADLKPLLAWDRASDRLSARKGTPMITRLNAGTIPDRGNYAVHLGGDGPRIGELDEEMVFETRAGECILLGASSWRVEEITRDRVIVSPAPGEPGKLPFWRGDGPGRPVELGRAIGAFCRRVERLKGEAAADWIRQQTPLDDFAAGNLAAYIQEQRQATGVVPSDRTIVVERFRDELGDWRVCILTPFGARIHAPWAMALQWQLERREGFEVQVMYTDDGIVLRLADGEALPDLDALLPPPDEVEERITEQLADTSLFASLFRENAGRALLMPRRSARGRQPLWAQRLKAQNLLAVVRRYPGFPVVLETYRQALSDVFDLTGLKTLLGAVRSRSIRVHEVETQSASPFARSLVFAYVAAYIYEQDAPLAERRAQALTLDRGLLAELLGQAELRELIDPRVLDELEAELAHLDPERRARDADELHDLLRRLGDLTDAELAGRSTEPPAGWLARLQDQRRAVQVRVAGQLRWIAAEDAGLYRDALGCVPPPGLPEGFIAPTTAPLEHLLTRYARTHGPFPTTEVARRFGLRAAQVEPVLRLLETRGVLVHGEIRPLGVEPEWCDAEVMRRLRRRTLARARDEVAPVDGATLARFLPAWHGLGEERRGPERLLEAVMQLEGFAVSWGLLDRVLLPARVPGYRSEDLDMLAATGQVVWVGQGALGPKDGRIALYRRENLAYAVTGDGLSGAAEPAADGTAGANGGPDAQDPPARIRRALLDTLRQRGACFLMELEQVVERAGHRLTSAAAREDFERALWDLVWDGVISNDTFAPLRALGARGRPASARGRRGVGAHALAGGRWSLVATPVLGPGAGPEAHAGDAEQAATVESRRQFARAHWLLERYGVVSREAVAADGLPGGFSTLYRVLKQMEESGRVRRGHFVEGLSGAQFALPGAVERLRAARLEEAPVDGFGEEQVCVLSAADPANPYGSLLPWPRSGAEPGAGDRAGNGRSARQPPKRVAAASVVLVAGWPVFYVGAGGRQLLSFPDAFDDRQEAGQRTLALALAALQRLPTGGRKRLLIQHIDGLPALESPLREAFLGAGFELDYDALVPVRWRPRASVDGIC
ncbi:Lhr family helicase [Thiohalocapsa marina]|uniref:Lhr family helicase n=1 Tax=Thiohalocapsa marina TaxID=424902 RepID=UPI0036DD4B4E